MELNEFLEKFLPEYEQKKKNYLIEAKLISLAYNKDYNSEEVIRVCTENTFNNEYFPEALQNFTDIICEKQRINCAAAFANFESPAYREIEACYRNIYIAEQPNVEELM